MSAWLRAQLAPGDAAVAVGVEADREVEVAQRDVPAAVDARRRRRRRASGSCPTVCAHAPAAAASSSSAARPASVHQRAPFELPRERVQHRALDAGARHPLQHRLRPRPASLAASAASSSDARIGRLALQREVLRAPAAARAAASPCSASAKRASSFWCAGVAAQAGGVEARRQLASAHAARAAASGPCAARARRSSSTSERAGSFSSASTSPRRPWSSRKSA